MSELAGKDRLIVALDVDSHEKAMGLVDKLDNVLLFKVGYFLLMTGPILRFIDDLRTQRAEKGKVFLDIKIAGDIGNTLEAIVKNPIVKFLTLIEARESAITRNTINATRTARGKGTADRGKGAPNPHLLMTPFLSSLDTTDLKETEGRSDLDTFIAQEGKRMLDAGCDGLIVSGNAIKLCRKQFGDEIDIVSPGIRPAGSSHDDHKRFTTPSQAIALGADYLVVGRPIINAPNPKEAAQRIIDEIDEQLSNGRRSSAQAAK